MGAGLPGDTGSCPDTRRRQTQHQTCGHHRFVSAPIRMLCSVNGLVHRMAYGPFYGQAVRTGYTAGVRDEGSFEAVDGASVSHSDKAWRTPRHVGSLTQARGWCCRSIDGLSSPKIRGAGRCSRKCHHLRGESGRWWSSARRPRLRQPGGALRAGGLHLHRSQPHPLECQPGLQLDEA